MYAAFRLGVAIGIFALEQKSRGFDARLVTRLIVDQFHLVAASLAPAAVHAAEHFGPVLAFRATCASVDFQIGVARISFARQQRLDLILISAVRQRLQRRDGFVDHILITLGLSHFDEFGSVGLFAF